MVRKWSYLESSNLPLETKLLNQSTSLYHFKVFRKTTRFKKFNKGLTKMVRKNYARRKHRTNWLILSYITQSWVSNYLNMRQFERFFSGLTRFSLNTFSADVSVFNAKLKELSNKDGINIITCSQTPLKRYVKFTNGSHFLINPTKYTNNSIVQTNVPSALSQSTEVFPNVTILDNHSYTNYDLSSMSDPSSKLRSLTCIDNLATTPAISISASVYSVTILLTLFNIHRNEIYYDIRKKFIIT